MNRREDSKQYQRQPVFLLPGVVVGLVGITIATHLAASMILGGEAKINYAIWFGFIPVRLIFPAEFPGGLAPLLWTPVTHAFLHAGWEHLLMNVAWMAIFGTPVARRYGAPGFLVIFFLGAIAGAIAFAATTLPNLHVLMGASGGIAGLTGAATRFVFQPVEVAKHPETGEIIVLGRRLLRLRDLMGNTRSRAFILIWVGLNGLMPLLPLLTGGGELQIAWQAHLGGFFCGLLIVPFFERRPKADNQE